MQADCRRIIWGPELLKLRIERGENRFREQNFSPTLLTLLLGALSLISPPPSLIGAHYDITMPSGSITFSFTLIGCFHTGRRIGCSHDVLHRRNGQLYPCCQRAETAKDNASLYTYGSSSSSSSPQDRTRCLVFDCRALFPLASL